MNRAATAENLESLVLSNILLTALAFHFFTELSKNYFDEIVFICSLLLLLSYDYE